MEMATNRHGDILDISGAAYLLQVRAAQVLSSLEHDTLPARRVGGQWRFDRAALREWIASGSSSRYANPFFYRLTAFNLARAANVATWLF
jgi:excisionase family DNA binding protein